MLTAVCQVIGIAAAILLLPGYLIDLAFGTDIITTILAQAALAAFACALMVAVWIDQKE